MDEIFKITGVRRFILGLQGLWPGRRWSGKAGVLQAFDSIQALQMDPLNVVARSHDLALNARVSGYSPDLLSSLLYEDRQLFDYGGGLFIYPMRELPYWRNVMRNKGLEPRWANFAAENPELLAEIRSEVRRRGPVRNRDFTGRKKVTSYRARKDSGLALFYLWLTGELMTSRRENFERVYDFSENIAPAALLQPAGEAETIRFFARKALAFRGLLSLKDWKNSLSGSLEKKIPEEEATRTVEALLDSGEVMRVGVEGWKQPVYLLAEHYPMLVDCAEGRTPESWQGAGSSTLKEVRFLAPLDIVSARGRAKPLFGFDYVWEVYKPAELRRWGYYTLPILFGDSLPARIDLKLDRSTKTLLVQGFWLEDESAGRDEKFAAALAAGLRQMSKFTGAQRVDLSRMEPERLRKRLSKDLDH